MQSHYPTPVADRAASKPSRSDEVLETEQQLRISDQVRAQFEAVAPKRPAKPSRSESDSRQGVSDAFCGDIPELNKLRSLWSQSQIIFSKEDQEAPTIEEEFVETKYYEELGSVDKQHHTTGNGFIKIEKAGAVDAEYDIQPGDHGLFREYRHPYLRGNPVRNDWFPSNEQDHSQVYISSKPTRSEGS